MVKLIFMAILTGMAVLIFLVFGNNKRERKKVPSGMVICCDNPFMRYIVYALGVCIVLFVGACVLMCGYAGALHEAGTMMYVCIVLAVFIFFMCLFLGQMMAASFILFDDNCVVLNRPFRRQLVFQWYELGVPEQADANQFCLYDRNGKYCFRANANMINYDKLYHKVMQNCVQTHRL